MKEEFWPLISLMCGVGVVLMFILLIAYISCITKPLKEEDEHATRVPEE